MGPTNPTSSFLLTRGVSVAALTVGVLLVLASGPRSAAAFFSLSAPTAIFQLEQGKELEARHLAQVEEDVRHALTYGVNRAELNSHLSYISLRRLLAEDRNTAARKEVAQALESVEAALTRRPLDSYLWTRYTHLSYLLDGLSPYTLAALDRSFVYGSNEWQLFQFRIKLCLLEWEKLPPSLRRKTQKQIEFGEADTLVWGHILADLPHNARERLLAFLAQTSADIERAQRIENSLRRGREAL